jgi:uncharacterized phiE125 gp8 family phage protein
MATLTRVSPPDDLVEPLLQSVCDHLRRFADLAGSPQIAPPDLAYIRELTRVAVEAVDGPAGKLGRCLLTQTWKLVADEFVNDFRLPVPPVRSITSVRYIDQNGTWQTLAADRYRLFGAGSWSAELAPSEGWPTVGGSRGAIEVTFIAGYGDEIEDVPAPILHGIRLLVAHWYLERQPVTFSTPHEIPMTASALFAGYRIYR